MNAAWLKLDLYCKGLRLGASCALDEDCGRPLLRTRAGLGSGLELILPGGLWTNVPVQEPFASASPYHLERSHGRYEIRRDGSRVAPVALAPRPDWYDRATSSGRPMRSVATLQGTYLGVYPARVCAFWRRSEQQPEPQNCRFCSVGLNLGVDDADGKSVDEVMEVVRAAWLESGITYVDFNAGHEDDLSFLDVLEPYVRRVKEETGLLIGVQAPPHPDAARYARLQRLGVNRVSFCFELFDRDCFARFCPGKQATYGLAAFLEAIEACCALRGNATLAAPWVVNGEIIAGLEPPAASLAAIDWLTARGAIPTVCVFRPLRGTALADRPPPRVEDVVPVFRHLYESCMTRGLPIGVAPNVHVSLVMLPDEARRLSPRRFMARRAMLAIEKAVFRIRFLQTQRLRKRRSRAATAPRTGRRTVRSPEGPPPRRRTSSTGC